MCDTSSTFELVPSDEWWSSTFELFSEWFVSLSTLVAAQGLSRPEKSRPTPVRVSESRAEFLVADALGF